MRCYGIRQVNVQGLVAAAFTHRDSRAGDPDLHTHVAVANKVQTLDGRWLSIDGGILFKATVAASETYNTALENHLRANLGLRFAERPNQDPRKRPIREIVGVNPSLNARWSARRASIETRRAMLAADFQQTHGRPPTPVESLQLAQQATLETREAKHEPRSLAEQRKAWFDQAVDLLGGPDAAHMMVGPRSTPSHQHQRLVPRGSTRQRIGCYRRWRNAVLPGRSGMYAPRRNARSEPPTCPRRKLIGSPIYSSTRF
jgi:hypothetical protein